MARQFQFTDKYLANLKPKEKKYLVVEGRGFSLRVLPSGVKTFLYVYNLNGKKKQLNLGIYPATKLVDARQKYNDAYNLFIKGLDPGAVKVEPETEENHTFGHFAKLYLEWSESNPDHSKAYFEINKLSLKNDVLPCWKDIPLKDIRRRDAIALLERVALRSKGQVANVHRAARGVFQYALERDYIDANPLLKLTKAVPAIKYEPKHRTLTEEEIRQIWNKIPPYLQLILITAQRPGEVAGIHRREVQVGVGKPICQTCKGCGLWTIPKERTKGRKEHLVYLTRTALNIIGDADGYVFPSPEEDRPIQRMALSRNVHRWNYYNLPEWTPHDLRRTVRTMMSRGHLEIPGEHAEAVLAHAQQGIKKVYNKYDYQEEKKEALLKWEQELLRIMQQ